MGANWIIALPVARVDMTVEIATGSFVGPFRRDEQAEDPGYRTDYSTDNLGHSSRRCVGFHGSGCFQRLDLVMGYPRRSGGNFRPWRQTSLGMDHVEKFVPVYGFVRRLLVGAGLGIHHPLL